MDRSLRLGFWKSAKKHFRKDGEPTGTAETYKPVLHLLCCYYGNTPAEEFGPKGTKGDFGTKWRLTRGFPRWRVGLVWVYCCRLSAFGVTEMSQNETTNGRMGILVGGGPAPGINGVIAAATLAARRHGWEVLGIEDGCRWLARGDISHVRALNVEDVEHVWQRGGSILHTSRENLAKDPVKMQAAIRALLRLGITHLVTIGGDDTAFTACSLSCSAGTTIRVAHVPKTIDNDLPLPGSMPTFGFETARHVGAAAVANLLEDARTTRRWHIAVTMGRSAGHLALGIGSAAGANLTLIPEELPEGDCTLDFLCELIEGGIFKSRIEGRDYGVVVIAEGVAERMREELKRHPLAVVKYDGFEHWRLAEVPLALILKRLLHQRAAQHADERGFIDATIGYELRCADPIPFDVEYTQQLGWGAVRYLRSPTASSALERGAMISIEDGQLEPIPFDAIMDTATGKTKVRKVALNSATYRCARDRMLRLERSDLDNDDRLQALAAASGLAPEAFRERYSRAAEL